MKLTHATEIHKTIITFRSPTVLLTDNPENINIIESPLGGSDHSVITFDVHILTGRKTVSVHSHSSTYIYDRRNCYAIRQAIQNTQIGTHNFTTKTLLHA